MRVTETNIGITCTIIVFATCIVPCDTVGNSSSHTVGICRLKSDTARLMLANSEFLLLLNQSSTDRDELANLLHISDTQLGYITNVSAGCGLIRCAGNIVPFENSFPRNTRLYQLMTTKPDEALRGV